MTKFVFLDLQTMQVSAWEKGKMEANGDKEGDSPEGLAVDIWEKKAKRNISMK